jgi:hypothetical protein
MLILQTVSMPTVAHVLQGCIAAKQRLKARHMRTHLYKIQSNEISKQ